jgi:hypothetical protein
VASVGGGQKGDILDILVFRLPVHGCLSMQGESLSLVVCVHGIRTVGDIYGAGPRQVHLSGIAHAAVLRELTVLSLHFFQAYGGFVSVSDVQARHASVREKERRGILGKSRPPDR